MTATERTLAALAHHGCDPKPSGNGWSAGCPAHDDRSPSLSVAEGDDGRALVKCHAGCKVEAICMAVGLSVVDLMPTADTQPTPSKSNVNSTQASGKASIDVTYDYRDEAGALLFQAVRYEPKGFKQRRPKPDGGWDWSVKDVRIVPYRLAELLADATRIVVVVEGEKDTDNLVRIGVLATCNAGGAGKWTAEHAEFLRGRRVVVLPDNDDPGRKHAEQVAQSLHGIAKWVRVVALPDLPPKGDASDWLATGGTKDELKRLTEATPDWTPAAAKPWPELESFDELNLPEFPTQALPNVLRQWVEAESHATQTPADLAGLLALSVCSATIARRVVVEARPGWFEPVNLFTAILLGPGNRKSAVFADAMKPLRELEAELIETARPTVSRAESELRQDESRLKRLEDQAAKKDNAEARHQAGELAAHLAEQVKPILPRLIVDDATSEKLGIMLAEQGGRIASMSPEGGVFDLMAGMYSKSGIPQFGVYLMGHSGDDLNTDRVSRKSVRVERPALTCAYAMQPQVIEGLAENPAFRGRGLLARYLYAAPRSWIGQRKIAPTPVSDAIREAYHQTVRAMADVEGEHVLHLTTNASEDFLAWESEIETMLGDGGDMEIMRDWGAKLAGATLRLAAVLHCVERGSEGRIDKSIITAAIEIARCLIPHAEAVLTMMLANKETPDDDARYVLRWIKRHDRRTFTKRDAQQHGKRRFSKADEVNPALSELTRRGYIRLRSTEATGPGRPPSPTYDVSPAVFAKGNAKKRSHNSHNSRSGTVSGNSENIENASEQSKTTNRVQVTI